MISDAPPWGGGAYAAAMPVWLPQLALFAVGMHVLIVPVARALVPGLVAELLAGLLGAALLVVAAWALLHAVVVAGRRRRHAAVGQRGGPGA